MLVTASKANMCTRTEVDWTKVDSDHAGVYSTKNNATHICFWNIKFLFVHKCPLHVKQGQVKIKIRWIISYIHALNPFFSLIKVSCLRE